MLSINVVLAGYAVNIISVDDVSRTGVVEVIADGRTGPYSVSINLDQANIQVGNTKAIFNNISFGDHTAYVVNAYGCIVELPFLIEQCAALDIYFFLEGSFDEDTNMMTHDLFDDHILPGQTSPGLSGSTPAGQPYNIAPWNYNGTEGLNWSDSDYESRFPDASPVDWALLTLIDGDLSNYTELFQAAGVVDELGEFHFTCPTDLSTQIGLNNEFYARIEHRNHMGIMTPSVFKFSSESSVGVFDFRLTDSFRDPTSFGQIELQPSLGVWGMLAGDIDQTVDYPSYDITGSDKSIWVNQNGNFYQYLPSDLNLDNDVNGDDKAIWFRNNGKSSRVPK